MCTTLVRAPMADQPKVTSPDTVATMSSQEGPKKQLLYELQNIYTLLADCL
jgi:hypothetical protein